MDILNHREQNLKFVLQEVQSRAESGLAVHLKNVPSFLQFSVVGKELCPSCRGFCLVYFHCRCGYRCIPGVYLLDAI